MNRAVSIELEDNGIRITEFTGDSDTEYHWQQLNRLIGIRYMKWYWYEQICGIHKQKTLLNAAFNIEKRERAFMTVSAILTSAWAGVFL